MKNQTVELLIGKPGAGKSLVCVMDLFDVLVYEEGPIWTNLPLELNPDTGCYKIAEWVASRIVGVRRKTLVVPEGKTKKQAAAEWASSRIRLISRDVYQEWAAERSGPWDYFAERSEIGGRIWLDEFHNVCSKNHSVEHRQKWSEFVGELRHRHGQLLMITQDSSGIAEEVLSRCALQRICFVGAEERDPFVGAKLYDWWQLEAAWLTRQYRGGTYVRTEQRIKRWEKVESKWYRHDDLIYGLYRSYEKPVADDSQTQHSAKPLPMEWERLGRVGVTMWFVRRHFIMLAYRFSAACLLFWLVFLGGGRYLATRLMSRLTRYAEGQTKPTTPAEKAAKLSGQGQQAASSYVIEADHMVKQLQAENDSLRAEARGLKVSNRTLIEHVQAMTAVQALLPNRVILKNGLFYAVGEKIEDAGPFHGQTISRIDYRRGVVFLSGGTMLRLSRDAKARELSTAVPADLPRATGQSAEGIDGPRQRPASHDPGGANAAGQSGGVPRSGVPVIDRGTGVVGPATSIPKRAGSTDSSSARSSSKAGWGTGVKSGDGVLPRRSAVGGPGSVGPSPDPRFSGRSDSGGVRNP